MAQDDLNDEIARRTGENTATIVRRGFSLLCDLPTQEFDDAPPKAIDWDDWLDLPNHYRTCFIEELLDC